MGALFSAILVGISAAISVWITYFLVTKDFFLPTFLQAAGTVRWKLTSAAAWVLGVAGTTIASLVFIGRLTTAFLLSANSGVHRSVGQRSAYVLAPVHLWNNMSMPVKGVFFILLVMSVWSLVLVIDRAVYLQTARKHSRDFAPRVRIAIQKGNLQEAVKVAQSDTNSHLAQVVMAGLQEFRNYGGSSEVTEEQIESSHRALAQKEAIVHAKLKKGLSSLATIGSTAPFIGLFGTVLGILNAFQQIATQKTSGIGAVAGGISEALVTTAFGLLVALPAVMTFNYFTGKVEAFDVEIDESSKEIIADFVNRGRTEER